MALLNFRDVASASSAGPLRPGRLFRSAQPFHLDASDLAVVRGAGIATVIDLREPHEQVPPDWAPAQVVGVRVIRVPLADQILPSTEERQPPRQPLVQADSVLEGHRILAAFYRAIVDQAGVRLGEVMTAVADGAPVLVHCAAGKDRTGTTVALLLDLIGTDSEAIVEDFLRTNDALDEVMMQLTGRTAVEAKARTDIPPGIGDAPEPSIRELLRHLQSKGGAAAVLRRSTDQATLDDVITTLTS